MKHDRQRQSQIFKLALEYPMVAQLKKQDMEDKIAQRRKYQSTPLVVVRISLYAKYSQSQNYYYTRDINEILSENVNRMTIQFKDMAVLDDEDEYLKRYYSFGEFPSKIHLLSEYYKFHTDIPRIFMEPINTVLNRYYDKRRKFEYYRIAKLIEEENKKNPDRPPKGIVGERPSPVNSLEEDDEEPMKPMVVVNTLILKDISELNRSQQQQYSSYASKKPTQANRQQTKDQSVTLHDIWKNLEKQRFDKASADDTTIFQGLLHNQESAKLALFIKFMKDKQEQSSRTRQQTLSPKTLAIQASQQQTMRINKQRVVSEQADANKPPQFSIERLQSSKQATQKVIEQSACQTQPNSLGTNLRFKDSTKQPTQPSSRTPTQIGSVNVAAKQFQINLLNLKDLKHQTHQPPMVQTARVSSAIDQEFKDAIVLSNLKRLNFLKTQFQTPNGSNVNSPSASVRGGPQIKKENLFQGNPKSVAVKKAPNAQQQPSQATQSTAQTQSKNQTSDQDQSKQIQKVAKLQTIYIEEELDVNTSTKFNQHIKQGAMTHRPKVNSQNFFNSQKLQTCDLAEYVSLQKDAIQNVHKIVDQQKRQLPIDVKKLSMGNLEHLQQSSLQAPLSNRSHQPSKSGQQSPVCVPQQQQTNPARTFQKPQQHSNQSSAIMNEKMQNTNQKQYLQELIKQADSMKKKLSLDQQQILYSKNLFLHPTKDFIFQSEQSGSLTDRIETNVASQHPHHKKLDPKTRMITPGLKQPSPGNSQIQYPQGISPQPRVERPASRTGHEIQPPRRVTIQNKRI